MSLVESDMSFTAVRLRLLNPHNAKPDDGIDLKRKPKNIEIVETGPETVPVQVVEKPVEKPYIAPRQYPTYEDISRSVCRAYNLPMLDLRSHRRTREVVRPRQVLMYMMKTLTLASLPEIGRYLGGRDHTTALHGIRKIERLASSDSSLRFQIDALKVDVAARFNRRNALSFCFDPREI